VWFAEVVGASEGFFFLDLAGFGEADEFFALGGAGRVVLGEDALEEPGSGAPATALVGGFVDDVELSRAEVFAGAEEFDRELRVILLPAGDGGGAEAGELGGGGIGAAGLGNDLGEEVEEVRREEGGAAGFRGGFGFGV
jgi:hypothetical protein